MSLRAINMIEITFQILFPPQSRGRIGSFLFHPLTEFGVKQLSDTIRVHLSQQPLSSTMFLSQKSRRAWGTARVLEEKVRRLYYTNDPSELDEPCMRFEHRWLLGHGPSFRIGLQQLAVERARAIKVNRQAGLSGALAPSEMFVVAPSTSAARWLMTRPNGHYPNEGDIMTVVMEVDPDTWQIKIPVDGSTIHACPAVA